MSDKDEKEKNHSQDLYKFTYRSSYVPIVCRGGGRAAAESACGGIGYGILCVHNVDDFIF